MALNDINNSTIGYDPEAMKTAMSNIKANLIDQTNNSMAKYIEQLKSEIDEAWRGASADKFKQNMDDLVKKMQTTIDTYYDNLDQEMAGIIQKMSDAEANLVGKENN